MDLQQIIGLRQGTMFARPPPASSYGGTLADRMQLGQTRFSAREPETFVPGFSHGSKVARRRKRRKRKLGSPTERIVADILEKGHIGKKQRLLDLNPALGKESRKVAEFMEDVHHGKWRKRGRVQRSRVDTEPTPQQKKPRYEVDVTPEEKTDPGEEPEEKVETTPEPTPEPESSERVGSRSENLP